MTAAAAVASPVDFETFGDYRVKAPPRADGAFVRPLYPFQGRVSADGSTGYPAEAGRYHLYISLACPWAHRSAIVRALLGLEDVVSILRDPPAAQPAADRAGRAGPGLGRPAAEGGPGWSGDALTGGSWPATPVSAGTQCACASRRVASRMMSSTASCPGVVPRLMAGASLPLRVTTRTCPILVHWGFPGVSVWDRRAPADRRAVRISWSARRTARRSARRWRPSRTRPRPACGPPPPSRPPGRGHRSGRSAPAPGPPGRRAARAARSPRR